MKQDQRPLAPAVGILPDDGVESGDAAAGRNHRQILAACPLPADELELVLYRTLVGDEDQSTIRRAVGVRNPAAQEPASQRRPRTAAFHRIGARIYFADVRRKRADWRKLVAVAESEIVRAR